jgi:hypothetical protein
VLAVIAFGPVSSAAQFGAARNAAWRAAAAAQEEVEEAAKKKAPPATGLAPAPAPAAGSTPAAAAAPAAPAQAAAATTPSFQAYSKYDFVPGEKVVAVDDFTQAEIGDFPAKWNTNGSGEVVTLAGRAGRWLKITNGTPGQRWQRREPARGHERHPRGQGEQPARRVHQEAMQRSTHPIRS